MTAMNETSTITLPKCHNLLALLLLNLNTPPVSSSSTTQEEELKKKERRENTHTEPGAKQQNGAGRQVPDPDKETDLTHKIHHQKRDNCHTKKRKTDKTSLPPASTQTQTMRMREESHTKGKRKKKNHTTHSRLTSQHHPATQPTRSHPTPAPLTYPHISLLHLPSPLSTPYPHTAHTSTNTFLHTYAHPATIPCPHTARRYCTHHLFYHPSPLYHHPCLHPCRNCTHACLGLATARPQHCCSAP